MENGVILLRYGEIGLKGRNRSFFEDTLVRNVSSSLGDIPSRVTNEYGRVIARVPCGESRAAVERLKRVFGVVSLSPAVRVPLSIEAIEEAAYDALSAAARPPFTFRVSASRANKRFPLTSPEINRAVGAYILDRFDGGASVDLRDPTATAWVEVRSDGAYVYSEVIPGPGGLPLGSSGKGLLLLSGGIDSPVAGWYMMKRGLLLEALHFYSFPFTSEKSKRKVMDLCETLSTWGSPVVLHVCPFGEVQQEIGRTCPDEMITIVMRRMMLRIAERVALKQGCQALITGESVGQVASQTLESMATIGNVTRMTILRPLCGLDKTEIIARAREIGTFGTSIQPYEDCCALFVPKNPRTKPGLEQAESAEGGLDVEGLVKQAVERIETITPQ
ncbi:MAG: tRNA 4-thiouridine(8) synthase ThiI [Firmicutes bacterium]|nr:tRNA 4-thiouridine(8) synthase ThiI [Bacillota bacterium]